MSWQSAFQEFCAFVARLAEDCAKGDPALEIGAEMPACPACGRKLAVAWGRHTEEHFITHPICDGKCPLWARSWHLGAKTPAEAVARYRAAFPPKDEPSEENSKGGDVTCQNGNATIPSAKSTEDQKQPLSSQAAPKVQPSGAAIDPNEAFQLAAQDL